MPSLLGILLSWFPMLLLIGVWIFFMRQMQGGRGGAMGFGKSKAKLLSETKGKVTFNDVGPDCSSSFRAIPNVSKSKQNYGF